MTFHELTGDYLESVLGYFFKEKTGNRLNLKLSSGIVDIPLKRLGSDIDNKFTLIWCRIGTRRVIN